MTAFAYQSDNRFMGAPAASDQRYAVAGVTWDGSTTNRPGARFGPQAIRRASQMLCDGTHPYFGVSPLGQLGDAGDLPLPNTGVDAMRAALEPQARALLQRHHMVWLGGDHAITLSLLRQYRQALGRPLAVVHFDAHCDTWTDHFGEPSGHGTWVHEAFTEGLVEPRAFMQLGIRSAAEREARDYVATHGGLIHDARSLRGRDGEPLAALVGAYEERWAAQGRPPLYISLDIDVLDPAFAPGTGTPEPAGLSTTQVFTLLEALSGRLPCVGMDCVEVSPPYDHAELTAYAAAQMVWTYLCGQIARPHAA